MQKNLPPLLKKQDDKQLEASKWIDLPLLVSKKEMELLLNSLGTVYLYPISRPITPDFDFLKEYGDYVNSIKEGQVPKGLQAYLLTNSLDTLYALQLADGKELIRAYLPSIFIRPHNFTFSPLDQKFRSKVYGENAITWGYTFTYPQFCIDPTTHDAEKVDDKYSNTALFKQIQKWIRDNTTPTPFIYEETKINAPIRIGKEMMGSIQNHFQLKKQNLHVSS